MISAANRCVRFALLVAICAAGGCSLAHRGTPPPQQQFLEALQRGAAPQASQIWLHMSASDRAKLSHGIGIRPEVTPGEVRAAILKAKGTDTGASAANNAGDAVFQDNINDEQIEFPSIDRGGLLDLPSYDSMAPGNSASSGN
jgi:hypothetical protein